MHLASKNNNNSIGFLTLKVRIELQSSLFNSQSKEDKITFDFSE